eukprot:4389956-Prymnesium_polylepis.1
MLPRLQRLLHDVASEGPDTPGWTQRGVPCPRRIRSLNVTEVCCQSEHGPADAVATMDADHAAVGQALHEISMGGVDVDED